MSPQAVRLDWMGETQRTFQLARAFGSLGFEAVLMAGRISNMTDQTDLDSIFFGQVIRLKYTGAYPKWIDAGYISRR